MTESQQNVSSIKFHAMALKLKIKKTLLKRKVEGVTKEGYYGRSYHL